MKAITLSLGILAIGGLTIAIGFRCVNELFGEVKSSLKELES